MSKTQRAMEYCIKMHEGQKRKYTNEPYWKHPAEVAAIVSTVSWVTENMIVAAWLHDVVEDTASTRQEVERLFGEDVARFVAGLTNISSGSNEPRAKRKVMDSEHVASGCAVVQTIKCADIISNCSSIVSQDLAFASVYLPEKMATLEKLKKADVALLNFAKSTVTNSIEQLNFLTSKCR